MTYYISHRFLDKLAVHITKNFLDLPGVRTPLILGIHGRKGEGKTFQCELVFAKMGFEPVTISGGELESPDAGDPARLIRLRYREAAEQIKVRGQMCALFINDLDAGAGRFDVTTQYTVNTQLVNATLMNIADNPTNVQLPGSYDATPLHRVPIIVTGNDFATLYAPLIRDGRMQKFYWEPDRDDKVGIVGGIFATDGLSSKEIESLIDAFPTQAIDFFSALRSRIYDEQISSFVHNLGVDKVSKRLVNSTEKAPEFRKPTFNLAHLIEVGQEMVGQQNRVQEMRLVDEYNQYRVGDGFRPPLNTSGNQPLNQLVKAQNYFRSYAESHPDLLPPNPIIHPHSVNDHSSSFMQGDDRGTTLISGGQVLSTKLALSVVEQIEQIISGGYKIGIEYADKRRFKTGSWQTFATVETTINDRKAIAVIEQCLAEHSGDYVRIIGIDTKAKRRVVEVIIHRPS